MAVLRVASAFDDLVGEVPERAHGALALLDSRYGDAVSGRVLAVLRERWERDPAFVASVIACGAPLTSAAALASVSLT